MARVAAESQFFVAHFKCFLFAESPSEPESPLFIGFHQRNGQSLRSDSKLYVPQRRKTLRLLRHWRGRVVLSAGRTEELYCAIRHRMRPSMDLVGIRVPGRICRTGQLRHKFWRCERGRWHYSRAGIGLQILYRGQISLFASRWPNFYARTSGYARG